MYHSVNIDSIERGTHFNTYGTLDGKLIPDKRPLVKPPEVKKSYVEIPGANGALDYTSVLNGILYNNRTGSWEFYVENGYQEGNEGAWNVVYTLLMEQLHGKYFDHIWLEDDTRDDGKPEYYYKGRVFVNEWKSDPQYSKVVLDYELEPYKYPTPTDGSLAADWLWDSLFSDATVNPIRYGSFYVQGTKDRTIIGSPNGSVTAFAHSSGITVTLPNGDEIPLPANASATFSLSSSGKDRVTFEGYGTVDLYYDKGPTL